MTAAKDIGRLTALANLILDSQLVQVQQAAAAKRDSELQIQGLASPARPAAGVADIAAELAALAYQRWADARRSDLNLILARQTSAWLDARDAARLAFGRSQALRGIAENLDAARASKQRQ